MNFPNDEIVGEEDSQELQENSNLADQVLSLITKIQQETAVYNDTLGTLADKNEVFQSIDYGNSQGGLKGDSGHWTQLTGPKGFSEVTNLPCAWH